MAPTPHFQGYRSNSLRHPGWNYSGGGWYFITICTGEAKHHFGRVEGETVILSKAGELAKECWLKIPTLNPLARLDQFVVMPNHLHGILDLDPPAKLGTIIGSYKSAVYKACAKSGQKLFYWQKNYYEHIIRNEPSLIRIRQYILNNPLKWDLEKNSPENIEL